MSAWVQVSHQLHPQAAQGAELSVLEKGVKSGGRVSEDPILSTAGFSKTWLESSLPRSSHQAGRSLKA